MNTFQKSEEKTNIRAEIRGRTVGYVLTALGLVAGLAWNDAIAAAIQHIFPLESDTVVAKFGYAAVMTIVVVGISTALVKWIGGEEKK